MEETADVILERVRGAGGRITASRRAIVESLVACGGHASADDLLARLQSRHPDLADSTVYRNLAVLEELGVVEHLHVAHGPTLWHLPGPPHHHLICDLCGSITHVPGDLLARTADEVATTYGFRLDAAHVGFAGQCQACATTAGR